ncbi:MAG: dockerin type I domain-containing protein [Chthoniobacterales bacterium]
MSLASLLLSNSINAATPARAGGETGTRERSVMVNGSVVLDLDLSQLGANASGAQRDSVRFETGPESFFTMVRFNEELRGPEPGSLSLKWSNARMLPGALNVSANQLVLEKTAPDARYELVLRDGKTGFVFFNIEGAQYQYDAATRALRIEGGRLLISEELAKTLGRPAEAGAVAGGISIAGVMSPIEVTTYVNGQLTSASLPRQQRNGSETPSAGPDIIVGDMTGFQQFGSASGQVGLATGATSCNNGDQDYDFFQLPNTDHSVISQNLYRMSGGATNDQRMEQIGQSWVKHTFGADQNDACGFGCNAYPNATKLGVGCSDPYLASQNGFQGNTNSGALGSRAWVNPFTGSFPASPRPENHNGHTHTGTSHRILVNATDLDTTMNAGATYFLEVQYDSPQEYAWCMTHAGQCNMFNNASYRQYTVAGTTSFSFSPVAPTVRMTPATGAWTGATSSTVEPAPGTDGRAYVVYKVTGPVNGLWHYEYAIHNQNLDRAVQSFSVPLGCGINVSNIGFHAPPNHPGFPNDGTVGDAGFSNTPWISNQTPSDLTWTTETFAQNSNANAIRFGTLYNFRFDSDRPPTTTSATVGFFKTGNAITVAIQAPSPCAPLQVASAVSRKTHGSAGDFDITLPLTGEPGLESRSTGGNHTIVVTFSNPPVSGQAAVTVGSGSISGSPTFSGNTMTVNLSGVTDVQKITVNLSSVTDSFGQTLPDTAVSMNVLAGDANANKTVNGTDVALTKSAASATAVSAANFRSDVNASGAINGTDVSLVKANSGHSVP